MRVTSRVETDAGFRKTSFRKNREAGIKIEGAGAGPILDFAAEVFEHGMKRVVGWFSWR